MAREGTRGASARKKSPKKAQLDEEAKAGNPISRNNDSKQVSNNDDRSQHPLARREGMNSRSILTGFYGARGERIRHVVANGALQLPTEALDIIASIEDELTKKSNGQQQQGQMQQQQQASKKKRKNVMRLPGLDSLVPPTMDKGLQKITVTDIFHKQFPNPNDSSLPPIMRTVAANRVIDLIKVDSEGDTDIQRIRGGGGVDEGKEEGNPNQSTQTKEQISGEGAEKDILDPSAVESEDVVVTSMSASKGPEIPANAPGSEASQLLVPPTNNITAATEPPTSTEVPQTQTTSGEAATALLTSESPSSLTVVPAEGSTPDAASYPTQDQESNGITSLESAAVTGGSTITSERGQVSDPTQPPTPSSDPQVASDPNLVPVSTLTAQPSTSLAAPTAAESGPTVSAAPSSTTTVATAPATVASTGTASPTPTPTPDNLASSQNPARRASALAPAEAATSKVIPLPKKPDPTWEQLIPLSNDENLTDPQTKGRKPDWYHPTKVSNLERTLMPEWFDQSAPHRTTEAYLKARATMIHISDQLGNRFVTSTLARRSLPGDVGSLHRLHSFLTHYLWMNEEARNDSCPTAPTLQQPPQLVPKVWTEKRRGDLIEAVVEASQQQQEPPLKKTKTEENDPMDIDVSGEEHQGDDSSFVPIDWNMVAEKVGVSPLECEREFLAMPMDEASMSVVATTERPITPDTLAGDHPPSGAGQKVPKDEMAQEELLRSLVEGTSPRVIKAVTEAALMATGNIIPAAQKAGRLGLVVGQAARAAQAHEETVSRLLSEVIDQRMQKLEVRMALMDDLEGMLEAERVALELERRDLYTTRCRDWFGGS